MPQTVNSHSRRLKPLSAKQTWSCEHTTMHCQRTCAYRRRRKDPHCLISTYLSKLFFFLCLACGFAPTHSCLHTWLSIQYHTHLILLHRPLLRSKQGRGPTSDSSATRDATHIPEAAYLNQHMEICRQSATQISKLMHAYKQHYTLVRGMSSLLS